MSEFPKTALPPTPMSWRVAIGVGLIALYGLAALLDPIAGPRGRAACGFFFFLGVITLFSSNLRAVNWRTIFCGIILQVVLAIFVQWHVGYELFDTMGKVVQKFLQFTNYSSEFVFGKLADMNAMNKVFAGQGFVFAFRALPPIIFVASFFSVLYYFGVLQFIVRIMARVMMYLLGTSGAETLSVSANVFMGQTEAPLIIRPFVASMTESEILTMMVGGMAHMAGGIMAVYISYGADPVAILMSSVMAAPCSLYLSKLLVPEMGQPETLGEVKASVEVEHTNAIDAAASGASEGMKLAINVAAMLIAFLAGLQMVDYLIGPGLDRVLTWTSVKLGGEPVRWGLSMQVISSKVFFPVAYMMGIESGDITRVAHMLGSKLVLNEHVAYLDLTHRYKGLVSPRTHILTTYALAGFANFGSIGIQLGGIGAMAPTRRPDLARMGMRALFVGFVVTLINACLAAVMMSD